MVVERDKHGFDAPAPLEHPARSGLPDDHATGPEVGDKLPDIKLPDQNGQIINLHEHRDGKKAAIIFYRSAVW